MLQLPPPPILADLPHVIQTARLRLRPIDSSDAADLWPHVSNPEVSKQMSWDAHRDIAETMAFIDGCKQGLAKGTTMAWAIEHDGRDRAVAL